MSTADFLTKNTIFNISTDDEFNNIALMVFKYQYKNKSNIVETEQIINL
jgi:hypothetical protein